MIDVGSIINSIKTILDSEKRFLIISWLFLGVIIAFLYNEKVNSDEKYLAQDKKYAEMIAKSREDCQDQMNISRGRQQAQLDSFMEEVNRERDSTFKAMYKTIKIGNQKTKENINQINDLTNESSN